MTGNNVNCARNGLNKNKKINKINTINAKLMYKYFFQSASTMACQLTQQVRWQQYQNSLQQSGDLYEDFKKPTSLRLN